MTDVVVLGGGVIGLTAAIRLGAAGADVAVWSPVDPLDTVSAVAAAVWYPTRIAADPRVLRWAAATYDEFTRQAAAGVPGVMLRPTRNLGAATALPWWAPAAGEVTLAGGEVRFVAPLAEMGVYLPWLRSQVRLVRRGVERLGDVFAAAPVVVNATGLAARTLVPDPAVRPARGQIVLVANPGVAASVRAEGSPSTYVHPRSRDVVTFWDVSSEATLCYGGIVLCSHAHVMGAGVASQDFSGRRQRAAGGPRRRGGGGGGGGGGTSKSDLLGEQHHRRSSRDSGRTSVTAAGSSGP